MPDVLEQLRDRIHDSPLPMEYLMDDAADEIELLRRLLTETPVLIIDERAARLMGEDKALAYMEELRKWHPRVQAALGIAPEINDKPHGG